MRVAFIWEWGAGLGHLSRFVPIAGHLTEAGHEVTIISRDLQHLPKLFPCQRYRWLAAPVLSGRTSRPIAAPRNIAEIAWNLGYDCCDGVIAAVRIWKELFEHCRPDLVVTDFGLAGAAVARGMQIRCLRIGTGYTCPPASNILVSMSRDDELPPRSIGDQVLEHLNLALRVANLVDGNNWADLIVDDESTLLATTSSLDPYRHARPQARYNGVWFATSGQLARWQNAAEHLTFGYLKPFRHFAALCDSLQRMSVCMALFGDAALQQSIPQRYSSHVSWQSSPVDMRTIQSQCRFAICNANHGTTARLLSLGIPILAIPLYFEQSLTAQQIHERGWGITCDPNQPAHFATAIEVLLHDGKFAAQCAIEADRMMEISRDPLKRACDWFDRHTLF